MGLFTKTQKPFVPTRRGKNCEMIFQVSVHVNYEGDSMNAYALLHGEKVALGDVHSLNEVSTAIGQTLSMCCRHCFRRLRECEIEECSDCKQEIAIHRNEKKS